MVNRSDKLILELLPVSMSCGNEIFRKEVSSINLHHLSVRNFRIVTIGASDIYENKYTFGIR